MAVCVVFSARMQCELAPQVIGSTGFCTVSLRLFVTTIGNIWDYIVWVTLKFSLSLSRMSGVINTVEGSQIMENNEQA